MIKFTLFLTKKAKVGAFIPYSDFIAIARGKEGKLLDFFLSVSKTGIVELKQDGLKVVATAEELAVFKRETYKISSPFTDFKKFSIFDLNKKAKKFSVLSLRILDYVKNNLGCELEDVKKKFNVPEFSDAYTFLLNESLIAFLDGELFVAVEDREYQLLINNLKSNGITLDAPIEESAQEKTELKKYRVTIHGRDFLIPFAIDKTPERLIYDYYMACENPQEKTFLREKKVYLLNYSTLLDEKSTFKMFCDGEEYELNFGVLLKTQVGSSLWNEELRFEAEFYFKSFN